MPESQLPDWLPETVAFAVHRFRTDPWKLLVASEPTVVDRLATDSRMKPVWQELTKKAREGYRPTEAPFHQGTIPDPVRSWAALADFQRSAERDHAELGDEETARYHRSLADRAVRADAIRPPKPTTPAIEHGIALQIVFVLAIALYVQRGRTVSRADIEAWRQIELSAGRTDIATAIERQVGRPDNRRYIVDRHRSNPRLEFFVEALAKEMKVMFGDSLCGVIARIANVLFERDDLRGEKVRAMLRRAA